MDEVTHTILPNNNGWGDVLANSQAENQALKAQIFSINAMNAQTAAIINALKPATTTAGA